MREEIWSGINVRGDSLCYLSGVSYSSQYFSMAEPDMSIMASGEQGSSLLLLRMWPGTADRSIGCDCGQWRSKTRSEV